MIRIKVCGLKEPRHALAAAEAGADFVSMIFAPSPRQVSPERAREIAQAVREAHPDPERGPKLVGVFVNETPQRMNEVAEHCGLDYVQLHGEEPWDYCLRLRRPVIRALRLRHEEELERVCEEVEELRKRQPESLILLDTYDAAFHGGTGRLADLELAQAAAQRFPFLLAGGLTPQNVAQVLRTVQPWGVDASSGLERAGEKDEAKIRAFIGAVRCVEREASARGL